MMKLQTIFRAVSIYAGAVLIPVSSAADDRCGCERIPYLGGPTLSLVNPLRCTPCQRSGARATPAHQCEFCSKLSELVRRGCSVETANYSPYADSLFGRHDLAARFSEDARRRIMAATLAQDADIAQELTAPLRAAAEPSLRYAGNVVAAYAVLRSDRSDRYVLMNRFLAEMSTDETASGLPAADLYYLRALVALDNGQVADADKAAEQAVFLEPRFFSALALSVQLQLATTINATHSDSRTCYAHFRTLMVRMQRVMDLSPCLTLAAHLEVFLARRLNEPYEQGAFSVVQVYLALVSRSPKFAENRIAKFETAKSSCRTPVSLELRQWLATILDQVGQ